MRNEKRPVIIAGARPNFVKVAPLIRAFDAADLPAYLVHTGQHYDEALTLSLFRDLGMRKPDVNFGVGSGNHAAQTARVMTSFDDWVDNHPVSEVIVVGDVNSTVACALVAAKRGIPVAHVKAGLRAFDRTMPEEVNRVVSDALSSWLLTPSADANANLIREGIGEDRIFLVGNIMVDSLENALLRLPERTVVQEVGPSVFGYVLVTLHLPAMVDDPIQLEAMLRVLAVLSDRLPVIFPVHPRTRARIDELSLCLPLNLHLVTPMIYLDFIAAQAGARLVVTDSGGCRRRRRVSASLASRHVTNGAADYHHRRYEHAGGNRSVGGSWRCPRRTGPTSSSPPPITVGRSNRWTHTGCADGASARCLLVRSDLMEAFSMNERSNLVNPLSSLSETVYPTVICSGCPAGSTEEFSC